MNKALVLKRVTVVLATTHIVWGSAWAEADFGHQSATPSVSVFHYSRPNSNDTDHAALELSFAAKGPAKGNLYAASFLGDDEKRIQLGMDVGETNQFSVTSGQGVGYAKTRQVFSGVDPYYFHGGSRVAYNYVGASWTHFFGEPSSAQNRATFGSMQISADELEKRSAWFAGIGNDNFHANLVQVDRGGESVGQALDLGFGWRNKAVAFQGLQSDTGAYTHQVQFSWYGASNDRFKMSLQTRNNPLTDDGDSNQIMFSYSKALGRIPNMLAATDTSKSDAERAEEARKTGFDNTLIIGAVAVGAAVAISSGSSKQDVTDRKSAQHEVAKSTLNRINPRSVRENREYGTWIYRTADGRYAAAAIQTGEVASVNLPVNIVPPGNTITASLHTHGGDDPRYANEVFSPADIAGDRAFGVDGYLGTPKGKFLWHDLKNAKVVQLGTIATK